MGLSKNQIIFYLGYIFVMAIITVIVYIVFCVDVGQWSSSKHEDYKKAMNCTTQCSETDDGESCGEVCENWGKTKFPWVVTSTQNLCKEDASGSDFRYAAQFPDPEAVREEFADNATFWYPLRSYSLTACIMIIIWMVCMVGMAFKLSVQDLGYEYWHYRIVFVFISYYWAYYWTFLGSPYYLVFSIKFKECVEMGDPEDMQILYDYKEQWLGLLVIGIIYPSLSFLLTIFGGGTEIMNKNISTQWRIFGFYSLLLMFPTLVCMLIGLGYYLRVEASKTADSFTKTTSFLVVLFILQLFYCLYPSICIFYDWCKEKYYSNEEGAYNPPIQDDNRVIPFHEEDKEERASLGPRNEADSDLAEAIAARLNPNPTTNRTTNVQHVDVTPLPPLHHIKVYIYI